ncbi:MAG: PH domain-containing protein [Sandaracinaceae bacterium]
MTSPTSPPFDVRAITRPHPKLFWQFLLISIVSGPLMPLVFLPLMFKYQTLAYRFDDEGVSMSWGYFWRREVHLTYARIQDIHVARGLIERWLGLGTVLVQTAAGSAGAEMAIIGVPEFEAVRDFMYARMRGAMDEPAPELAHAPTMAVGGDPSAALLLEIRDELRAIRASMGGF